MGRITSLLEALNDRCRKWAPHDWLLRLSELARIVHDSDGAARTSAADLGKRLDGALRLLATQAGQLEGAMSLMAVHASEAAAERDALRAELQAVRDEMAALKAPRWPG